MWAVVFLIEFITCSVKVYLPEKESMWGFQEIARMPPATPCFDVIINHFMVKCLNLIFHFNLSAFQHDVAVFFFSSESVWCCQNGFSELFTFVSSLL